MRLPFPLLARPLANLAACLAALALVAQPAAAQSVLRDAETEGLLQDMLDPLLLAAGMDAGQVDVVLLHDDSLNAFVGGGQRIYVHSGLINAAGNANEVQGVLAHELGHITGGHINRHSEGVANVTRITILSALLAAAAAFAGGGEAAMGLLAAGQQAAMGSYLAFSRVQEASADAAGVQYLSDAGISGRGSLAFFRKLQNLEYRHGISQENDMEYSRSHPMTGTRISRMEADYIADPAWDTPSDAEIERRFTLARAKLYGYLAEPGRVFNAYPGYMTGEPARYARAYAFHKEARIEEALAEADALLAVAPENPYFLELKGQILLESGRVAEALVPLREATRLTGSSPLIAADAWPCPARHRRQQQSGRGRSRAARRRGAGSGKSLRLVSARRGLWPARRFSARAAGQRRNPDHERQSASRADECRSCRTEPANRFARLDSRTGCGVAGPCRA